MASEKLLIYPPEQVNTGASFAEQCVSIDEEKNELSSSGSDATCEPTEACVIIHNDSPSKEKNKDKPKPSQIKCSHSQLQISCDDQITKIVPLNRPLEIVAGFKSNSKKVECRILDLTGPCNKHEKKTFDVRKISQDSNSSLTIIAESIPFYKIFENGVALPWNPKKSAYIIKSNTCNGNFATQLLVYPDLKILLSIPFNFGNKKNRGTKTEFDGEGRIISSKTSNQTNEITASYTEDNREWKISKSIDKKYKKISDVSKIANSGLKKLNDALGGSIEIDVLMPSGKIELEYKYSQVEGAHFRVESEYYILAKLKPFFGASANIHLDEVAVYAIGGPAGKFYAKLKRLMEKAGIEFGINLIITGTIEVEIGFKKLALEKEDHRIGAGLAGQVEVDLKAHASYEVTFIVAAKASAEAGVKTGMRGEAFLSRSVSNVNLDLVAIFLGVEFYYQVKVQLGEEEKKHSRLGRWFEDTFKSNDTSRKKSKLIVKEKKWPKTIQIA